MSGLALAFHAAAAALLIASLPFAINDSFAWAYALACTAAGMLSCALTAAYHSPKIADL